MGIGSRHHLWNYHGRYLFLVVTRVNIWSRTASAVLFLYMVSSYICEKEYDYGHRKRNSEIRSRAGAGPGHYGEVHQGTEGGERRMRLPAQDHHRHPEIPHGDEGCRQGQLRGIQGAREGSGEIQHAAEERFCTRKQVRVRSWRESDVHESAEGLYQEAPQGDGFPPEGCGS